MNMIDTIREKMVLAMKAKNDAEKATYSLLLSALKNKDIELRGNGKIISPDDEVAVVNREIKDCKDMLDELAKAGIVSGDAYDENTNRIRILSQFMPKQMDEAEINTVIDSVLCQLSISSPTAKDKGSIMKVLMPLVKGKADGKLVNILLMKRF